MGEQRRSDKFLAPQPHLPTPPHALALCASYVAPSTGKTKRKDILLRSFSVSLFVTVEDTAEDPTVPGGLVWAGHGPHL